MSSTIDALVAAANAENAAIFTYGVISAYVSSARRAEISDQLAAHRAQRDGVNAAISAAGGTPPEAASGYTLPVQVSNPVTAARAALAAETDCATAYRVVLEQSESDVARRIGVDGLTASALDISYWRRALAIKPVTVTFPGSPT
ncbi:ferritin-like domain-containing protein [Gordonia sp. ABSL49_1]|uniref:ferritin-like domain-containing protein n=1 Tax=Gordonia sp. ABSL49_1 TaxID=2920941 RepID=UPI001F113B6C|nr:ferritin-like domain-containing protein [Gordonia sp. ABSL49_1]MCH5642420.1 ferritin-like domain-containing protein [Gordonia sp. ABSL49_1]